jgi:polar amino acid transport system substrate-binding protein
MKKIALILTFALALTLVFVSTAPAGKVMDRILEKGELVVGTTASQPPMIATTKSGQIIGFDADLARLIAESMGVQLKFETMPFSELIPALENGKVDMILSGMTMLPKRNLKVAFVGPYYVSGKGILTKAKNMAALQEKDGLNRPDFTVAALKGSTSQMFVERAAPKAKLVTTKNYDEAIDMLMQDKIEALIADYPFCALASFRYSDKGLMAGQSKLTFEPLGIAIPEDALLINWMENYLTMLEGSGILKRLGENWFENSDWIKELP